MLLTEYRYKMAKQGMKRPEVTHTHPHNDVPPVPEIQGTAKSGKRHARPIISGTDSPSQKVYHSTPHSTRQSADKPISKVYPVIDTDLARDNLENDITDADLQDL